jgi:hypothetical protein
LMWLSPLKIASRWVFTVFHGHLWVHIGLHFDAASHWVHLHPHLRGDDRRSHLQIIIYEDIFSLLHPWVIIHQSIHPISLTLSTLLPLRLLKIWQLTLRYSSELLPCDKLLCIRYLCLLILNHLKELLYTFILYLMLLSKVSHLLLHQLFWHTFLHLDSQVVQK